MVITTAAAATNRTAIAAVSTVMQVANVLISRSRRAPKPARWAGTVGIAGRKSIGNALLNACAQGTHTDRLVPAGSGRLLRGSGQEGGQEHGEAERQPEQLGGN